MSYLSACISELVLITDIIMTPKRCKNRFTTVGQVWASHSAAMVKWRHAAILCYNHTVAAGACT
eukprot:14715-Heterococcus_DN1.PRE.3